MSGAARSSVQKPPPQEDAPQGPTQEPQGLPEQDLLGNAFLQEQATSEQPEQSEPSALDLAGEQAFGPPGSELGSPEDDVQEMGRKRRTYQPKTTIGTVANKTYNITGNTLYDVVKTIKKRPNGEAGKLKWYARVGAKSRRGGRVRGGTLNLTRTKIMPVWSRFSSAPQPAKDEWTRFHEKLDEHEDGHASLISKGWTNFASLIEGKKLRKATRMYDKRSAKVKKQDKAYDTRTRHGRTQGAVLKAAKDPRRP
jgi:predicted secreted Zn-dependent protease